MSNEIKQGDIVVFKTGNRAFEVIGKYIVPDDRLWRVDAITENDPPTPDRNRKYRLVAVDCPNVMLDEIPERYVESYSEKLERELEEQRKEALKMNRNEIKQGDKVVVHYPSGDMIGRIQEVMLDGTYDIDYGGGCTGHNITRSQIEPYTAPTIKVGDRVRCKNPLHLVNSTDNDFIGIVTDAVIDGENGWFIVRMNNGATFQTYHESDLELVEPTEQTEAEKPNHTITIPVEVDLTDSYWDTYAADLAKEVALKVANKFNDPEQAAEYAVSVAKAVVEGLKRK